MEGLVADQCAQVRFPGVRTPVREIVWFAGDVFTTVRMGH